MQTTPRIPQEDIDAFVKAAVNGRVDIMQDIFDGYGAAILGQRGCMVSAEARNSLLAVDVPNVSALFGAVLGTQLAAVEWLAERGADIDERGIKGYTPLMMAAVSDVPADSLPIAEYLIKNNARIDIVNEHGKTVEELALLRVHREPTQEQMAMTKLILKAVNAEKEKKLEQQEKIDSQMRGGINVSLPAKKLNLRTPQR